MKVNFLKPIKKLCFIFVCFSLINLKISISKTLAWDCETHAYIAKKAGLKNPEYACLPDIIREENYPFFVKFHYHSLSPKDKVSLEYIEKIKGQESSGILYWKIVDLYEKIKNLTKSNLYDKVKCEYYLYSLAHFIGDLSNPLHNFPYNEISAGDGKVYVEEGKFNKLYHEKFDTLFTFYLKLYPELEKEIDNQIQDIKISSLEELKKKIAEIANFAQEIALDCFRDKRLPTKEEVIKQIVFSISLLKAIYQTLECK